MPPLDAGWLIVLWLTALGGAIGSFLNVVVYRLPLGISLIDPPSHCPTCKRRIPWYDNVPVFGWIVLRGRCRGCGGSISIRYPLVEALTATMFGTLAAVEHFSQGANLPLRAVEVAEGFSMAGTSGLQLYCVYLFHLLLLCTLLCAALIEFDRKRPPPRLFVPSLAIGVVAPLVWPLLRPVAAWPGLPHHLAGVVDGLAGLAAGAALGGAVWWVWRIGRKKPADASRHPAGLFLCLICVGLYLGWQAVVAIALATAAVHCATWPLRRVRPGLRVPPSIWILIVAFAWILAWSRLVPLWEAVKLVVGYVLA